MSSRSVLIVEDDPSSSDILLQILEYDGMAVDCASSGEDALTLLQNKQYDIAILDLALPGIDGWQLHQEMQQIPNTKQTITIALTAFYSPLLAKQAKETGFTAAFPKPITPSFMTSLKRII